MKFLTSTERPEPNDWFPFGRMICPYCGEDITEMPYGERCVHRVMCHNEWIATGLGSFPWLSNFMLIKKQVII